MVWTPITRKEYARNRKGYASDMTEAEWEKIGPYLPPPSKTGRPRTTCLRAVMNGIFYLLQSGCQWDMLPKDFPPWQTVYRYFRSWIRNGTWDRLHDALYCAVRDLEGREASPTLAIIDAQSTKTGPDARGDVGFDAGKNVKGRKRHIVVDILGMVLKAEVHSAGIQDRDGAALVLDRMTARFPFILKFWVMAVMQGLSLKATAPDQWKSLNAPITPKASSSCQNDGSSSGHSPGLASTGDYQKILKDTLKPRSHSSTPP